MATRHEYWHGLALAASFLWISVIGAAADPADELSAAIKRGDAAEEARLWLQIAEGGNFMAQHFVALAYTTGTGVPQDYVEALKWQQRSAAQGSVFAMLDLGEIYRVGRGVPQDYVQAHKWFNLAGATTSEEIMRIAAMGRRDNVASMMTPAQIAEAQRLAREWKPVSEIPAK